MIAAIVAGGLLFPKSKNDGGDRAQPAASTSVGASKAPVVYSGSDDTYLYAVNATTGKLRWRYKTGARVQGIPVVKDGVVYVGSEDNKLHAVDAITGQAKWAALTAGEVGSPGVADGVVVVAGGTKRVYAFDAETGKEKWSHPLQIWQAARPAILGNRVYVSSLNPRGVLVFDLATGGRRGLLATRTRVYTSPLIADGVVYAVTAEIPGDDGGSAVYAFDATTGRTLWRTDTQGPNRWEPAIADGQLWVPSEDHTLYALALDTGAVKLTRPLQDQVFGGLTAAGDIVYYADGDNTRAIDARTGKQLWQNNTPGPRTPAVAGDRIVNASGFMLYAFDRATGK